VRRVEVTLSGHVHNDVKRLDFMADRPTTPLHETGQVTRNEGVGGIF
jgi:hypothetical protein